VIRTLAAVSLVVLSLDAAAKCAPKNVLKIVTTAELPGVAPDSFASAPRTLYRSGELLGRMEEPPNPETGLHLLFVINGADIWVVNRNDRTGQHLVDAGPDVGFGAPILSDIKSEYWNNFEYGCEVPFMTAVGAAPQETPDGGRLYVHTKEGITARLFATKDGRPARLELSGPGNDFSLVYKVFEEVAEPPADLFAKPVGVQFVERPD
jgi:hypothetical protein